ncbi:MAG: hypothetical protein KGI06_04810 [Candidatus Micrarchaeota archaeon]|nr:hypothetical protein [Candidatus Micrarchaeota archaeon]
MVENESIFLSTSFHAAAALRTNMSYVKDILTLVPNAKKMVDGPMLKYEISMADGERSLLELSDSHMSLRFSAKMQSSLKYKTNFLKFVSLMALLKGQYTVDISTIYDYIIEALEQNWQNSSHDQGQVIEGLKERINILDKSNFSLGLKLIEMSKEIKRISSEVSIYKEFSASVMSKTCEIKNGKKTYDYSTLMQFGVDSRLAKSVETMIREG